MKCVGGAGRGGIVVSQVSRHFFLPKPSFLSTSTIQMPAEGPCDRQGAETDL